MKKEEGQRTYNKQGLNHKQKRFCQEYIIDLNGTKAAERSGYSQDSAHSIANELLKKPEIKNYIQELEDDRARRTGITADRVIIELAKIAFSDVRSLYKEDGFLKLPHEMGEEAHFVSSIETDEIFGHDAKVDAKVKQGETKKVKLYDKTRALEHLGKHLGIFEKDNSQKKPEIKTFITGIDPPDEGNRIQS
jgi:phage terminase small subunit